jgi:hypothetical protein
VTIFIYFMQIQLSLLLFSLLASALAQEGHWAPDFYQPAVSGVLSTLVIGNDGALIYGGNFPSFADTPGTSSIARRDPHTLIWSGLAGGISGAVYTIVCAGNDLYVGGSFKKAGNLAVNNLARWDGTNWNAVGGGVLGGTVRTLAWHKGELFVGGSFTNAGGLTVKYVASWNGAAWSDLAGGVDGVKSNSDGTPYLLNVPVAAIYSAGEDLYVGGNFRSAGSSDASFVAKWDGKLWSSLGQNVASGINDQVYSLLGDTAGNLYVGGAFPSVNGTPGGLIARWDGTNWSSLGTGLSPISFGRVSALLTDSASLYVGGIFITAGDVNVDALARWDGTNWFAVAAPISHASALVSDGTTLYAVGGDPISSQIFQFDRSVWSTLGAGLTSGAVYAISPFKTNILVGGNFQNTGLAVWDGVNWTPLTSPSTATVYAIASDSENAYVAGTFSVIGDVPANHIARWNGSNWFALGNGIPTARSLAIRGTELFAGHDLGISRWDGLNWSPLGDGLNGSVRAIVTAGNDLYAGGSFTNSGNTSANYVARWDDPTWHPLGDGFDGPVYALALVNNVLYAGGDFSHSGPSPLVRLARWDGSAWRSLGSGLFVGNFPVQWAVRALTAGPDGALYVGGSLRNFGFPPFTGIARWKNEQWSFLDNGLSPAIGEVPPTVYSLAFRDADLFVGGDFVPPPLSFNVPVANPPARFAQWHLGSEQAAISLRVLEPSSEFPTIRVQLETTATGSSVILQHSADLITWLDLATSPATNTVLDFVQKNAPPERQFYRALQAPPTLR